MSHNLSYFDVSFPFPGCEGVFLLGFVFLFSEEIFSNSVKHMVCP